MPNEQLLRVYDPLHQLQEEPQQVQQKENVFQEETEAMLMRNSELQNSSYKRFGMTFKDSDEMTAVKQAQQALTDAMFGEMPADRAQLDAAVDALLPLYDRLIVACTVYVNKNEGVSSRPGQARLRLVRGSLHLATAERSMFRDCARTVFDEAAAGGPAPFWVNVLGEIRRVKVSVAESDTELGGAGTSEVTIIKHGDTRKYFKEEEKLLSPKEEFTARYITGKDKKEAAFNRQFLQMMEDDVNCQLKLALNHFVDGGKLVADTENAFQTQMDKLKNACEGKKLDWSNKKLREAFLRFAPSLLKWYTRWGISNVAGIAPESPLSNRNVATSRMAMMLGMPELIAGSSTALLQVGDRQAKKGNLMDQAVGSDYDKLLARKKEKNETLEYTPEMIRQLSALQVLDWICGQLDRNTGNYFVQEKIEGKKHILSGVQGIDNDFSFGVFQYKDLNYRDGSLQLPQAEANGRCTLPRIDEKTAEAVFALNDETVKHVFADLLSDKELEALLDRIHGIKELFRRSAEADKDFIVPDGKWDNRVLPLFRDAQINKAYVVREYVPKA